MTPQLNTLSAAAKVTSVSPTDYAWTQVPIISSQPKAALNRRGLTLHATNTALVREQIPEYTHTHSYIASS